MKASCLRRWPPALAGWALAFSVWLVQSAVAGEAAPASADPALDARVMRIAVELRCVVCQNQTIADSHSPLAIDLRTQVRTLLQQGRSEEEVLDYMTARYGDFVLYSPPLKATTAMLWFGPALLLVGGVSILLLVLRRRSRLSAEQFEPDLDEDPSTDPRETASR